MQVSLYHTGQFLPIAGTCALAEGLDKMSLIDRLREGPPERPVADTAAARILTIDIERLPGLAHVWEPRTKYVPPRNFVEWPRTVCFAARWYGDDKPIFSAVWHKHGHAGMIRKAWELYDAADIIVTFNGVNFDDRKLKTDWLEAGLPPPRPFKPVDLFRVVRREFGFESNSLDTVTRRLGRPGKPTFYSIEDTQAAVEGNREAQSRLRSYNLADIELTEWLYDRLRAWIHNHPHLGTVGDEMSCNRCGSKELEKQPSRYRAVVLDYSLYRCEHCGGLVRGNWESRAAQSRGVK